MATVPSECSGAVHPSLDAIDLREEIKCWAEELSEAVLLLVVVWHQIVVL